MTASLLHSHGRLFDALGLMMGVVCACFLLFSVMPGDPARIILGPTASPEAVENLGRILGTDRPMAERFVAYLRDLATLDLGRSIIDGRSVGAELATRFRISAAMGTMAGVFALVASYAVNLAAFVWPRLSALVYLTRFGVAVPTYCSGVLGALLFGVLVPVIPLGGFGSPTGGLWLLCLPAAIAALYPAALMTGILRERILEANAATFVRAAAAAGAGPMRLFHRTVLPSVSVGWLSAWVNQLGVVFVSTFVLEVIFTVPGVGLLLVRTVQEKDLPMLQGIVLVNAIFFIALSRASEALFDRIDPRRRTGVTR